MFKRLLINLYAWINSKTIPWYAPYQKAKRLHENSPHGLFKGTFYSNLSDKDIQDAKNCPKLSEAISLYKECLEREKKAGRYLNEGITLHQLGLVYHRQGRLTEAFNTYEESIKILENMPQSEALEAISACHFRISEIYLSKGDIDSAKCHLEININIDISINDKTGIALGKELLKKIEKIRNNQ